jgi:putative DNA primase/helicase
VTEHINTINPVNAEAIPAYFRVRPQWIVWKYETSPGKDNKPTKVLYNARTGRKASTTELMTWSDFEDAVEAYESSEEYDGIGFVFCSADPFVGIDFDDCRDPETGEVDEDVLRVIKRFTNAYVEVSPSGTGIHLITRGTLVNGVNTSEIELYGQRRWFTITGEVLD